MLPSNPSVFAEACDPNYRAAMWHAAVGGYLAGAIRKGGAREIINAPPRHGKSRLVAIEAALWAMVAGLAKSVVVATYALDLAITHSRAARERIANEEFRRLTDARIKGDHGAVDEWSLTNGASYKAVGVGGALTGYGGDLLILDDLHKDAQEAGSQTLRNHVWDWLQTVALTRLSPGASVILIGTRWHQDDATGRLLAKASDRWTVTNLPAIAHAGDILGRSVGEPLWPERFQLPALDEIRETISAYFWSALYDGNPVPSCGNHVNIDAMRIVPASSMPTMRKARFWDLAVTAKTSADYTTGPLCGRDNEGNFWICDMDRGQRQWTETRGRICSHAINDRCQVGIEAAGQQAGLISNLREVFPSDIVLTQSTPDKDKLTRALPWFALANAGKVRLVQGGWNAAFLDECQSFPLGAHDDQVDAVSGAHKLLFGNTMTSPLIIRDDAASRLRTALAWRANREVLI